MGFQEKTLTSLDAATSTGAGTEFDLEAVHRTFGLQVAFTGGAPTVKVTLDVSNNGDDWFTVATFDTGSSDASGDMKFAVDKPARYVRADLETLTGGTDPTVTAIITAAL